MKIKSLRLLPLALCFIFGACGEKPEPFVPSLQLFDSEGNAVNGTLKVEADKNATLKIYTNESWAFESDCDWVKFSPTSGNPGSRIVVNLAFDRKKESRSCSVILKSTSLSIAFTIEKDADNSEGPAPDIEGDKDKDDFNYPVKIVAHRGFHKNYKENSLEALQAALEMKCVWGSEFDVWKNKDGVLVINHDSPEGNLPTLQSFLEIASLHKDKFLFIEFKQNTKELVEDVVKMVKAMGLENNVVYISLTYQPLLYVKAINKDYKVCSASPNSGYSLEQYFNDGIDILDWSMGTYKSAMSYFNGAKAKGMEVGVWTVNSNSDADYWIAQGAQYITTDIPDEIAAHLRGEK